AHFSRIVKFSNKSVTAGGHAPTTVTPTGKFCGKLCARSNATSARFDAKFCRKEIQGCGVERRLRRMQRDVAGAAVAACKRASARAARCGQRNPDKRGGLAQPPPQRCPLCSLPQGRLCSALAVQPPEDDDSAVGFRLCTGGQADHLVLRRYADVPALHRDLVHI